MNKIHFHSLDALRFFAFLKVYLLHLPLEGDFPIFSYLKSGGGIGVDFFFVLSGFLITYLLVFDKLRDGQISIKKFFLRRSLRIWPLFYLIVIIVFLLPYDFKEYYGLHMINSGYNLDWRYSFTFLENYKMLIEDSFPKTTPLSVFWSLCIEEHFYIFWMISLFLMPAKYFIRFFCFCILMGITARILDTAIYHNAHITTCDLFTNLDFFAIGGMLGYWVAKDYNRISNYITNISASLRYGILFSILLIVILQKTILPNVDGSAFSIIRPTIIASVFTVGIAIFIPVDSIIRIKSKLLNYLGTISFGLYVFHLIVVHLSLQYCKHHEIKIDNWTTLSTFIVFTMSVTIILSALSYKYFESPFLLLRDRLTRKKEIIIKQA